MSSALTATPGFQDLSALSSSGAKSGELSVHQQDLILKKEYLTCRVCDKQFDFGKRAPHELPCGDTACLDCLRQYAGRNGKADEMFCPICDREVPVPGGHVCCFPPNSGTMKILEVFKLVEAYRRDNVPCMGCDQPGAARCLECQENYCEDHASFHGLVAATKHHTVTKFSDILEEPQKILRANGSQMCSKHSENTLEVVCTTCNSLACLVCAITDHKGHHVKEIGETMDTIQDRVSPLLKKVKQNEYDIQQNLNIAKDVDKDMNIMFQRCKRDLNIGFMAIVRKVRDRQKDLFSEVDHICEGNVKKLEDQIHAIEDEINFTVRGQYMLSDLYDEYSPAEVAGLGSEIERIIDDLQNIPSSLVIEPLPTVRVTFDSRSEGAYNKVSKHFGNLRVTEEKLSLEPKIPPMTALDSDEEEDLLPIDNSELSTLVKSKVAVMA